MKRQKFIALLTALLLFATCIMPAAAFADTIGKEAKACADLGILIGTDAAKGVTSEYLSTTPTRIQALIIFLRIKGLDGEALKYTWTDNFKDASTLGWVVGRNYLAYAKDNPDLGWIGSPEGNFLPNKNIDGKAFYKIMLETLGYNQDIDFSYNDTLKFAESIDLIQSAATIESIKDFTVNHVAKAIYSTLNTKPKGETKKLISILTENEIIDEEKAVKAGFKIDITPVEVLSFERLSNNKFLLELDKEFPLDKDDISIISEDGKEIQVVSLETSGKKLYIDTGYMTAFSAYNLSIDTEIPINGMAIRDYNEKFVALPRDTQKPKATAEIISNNMIKIYFDEEVERSTAEDISNYTIQNDIGIYSAELDASGKTVTLMTEPHRESNRYWLAVRNVTDLSGNAMDLYEKTYMGMPRDNSRPYVTTIQAESNKSILINFNEPVNKITAERMENYIIHNNALIIENILLDDTGKTVRLETSTQNPNNVYRITIKNVADLADNVMYEATKSFSGSSGGNVKFSASPAAYSNNEVEVIFSKSIDKISGENIQNYSIDNGLEITKAFLSGDSKVLTLITSDQTPGTKYQLEINNIYDIHGNVLNYAREYFVGKPKDTTPLSYTVKSGRDSIIITFNKRVEQKSAENVFNYKLDSSLGYAAKATLDVQETGRIVTLMTKPHESGKIYGLTVKDVTDLAGVPISTDDKIAKRPFAGFGNIDLGNLNLDAINAVDTGTLDLYFDNNLTEEELKSLEVSIVTENGEKYNAPKGLAYEKYFLTNKAVIRTQFKTDASLNPEIFKNGKRYEVRVSNIDRLNENEEANIKGFAGTGQANEPPYITDLYAINSTAVEVNFSEPVKGISPSQFSISGISIIGTSNTPEEVTASATLYLSNSSSLKDDKEYTLIARSGIKDAAGYSSIPASSNLNSKKFYGTSYANQPPEVVGDSIYVINKYTMTIEFNEPVKLPASGFSIRRTSGSGSPIVVSGTTLSEDKKTATIYLNSSNAPLYADSEYEITLSSSITDLQGLALESGSRKIKFYGNDEDLLKFEIMDYTINPDNKTITLITNNPLKNTNLSMDCFEITGANYGKSSSDKIEVMDKTIKIILRNALRSNDVVKIRLTTTGKSTIRDLNNQQLMMEEIEILTY